MPAFDEETFGPVAAVIRAKDADEAIAPGERLALRPGRGALDARRRARPSGSRAEIEAGCVFVNGTVASDPRLPFGGIKHSGYGRELAASASASS